MYNRKLVFTASCLGMLIFGIVMTTLGAILPSVIDKFGFDKANAGTLMMLMSFGMLLGSLIFGPLVDRYGYKWMLIVCASFIFFGFEGLAMAPDTIWLRIFIFLIGLGGGVINGGTNALVADISEEGKSAGLSILGVFFGIGAIGVPLLLGSFLGNLTYEWLIQLVGLLVLIPLIFISAIRFPSPKHAQGFPLKEGVGLLKELVLILFGLILFFQSGMEMTVGNWSAVFFNEELTVGSDRAVLILSLYWLGMVVARSLLGYLLKKISPAIVQFSSLGIALLGLVIMILSHDVTLSALGLFLSGFGFAAVYPVILGYIGERYAHLSGTAFSIALVMALIGGMFFPWLTGALGEQYGMRLSFVIVPAILCLSSIVFWINLKKISSNNM
ncbi:MFS transporter [candidate division KSB1 bacterium]|nr:MFS transporter [candidate division KSB1 bacterium]